MMISSSDVASSSSTPLPLTIKFPQKYDVFISFRGSDTRQNFTSHLYKAIYERGISTFIDDELRRGDPISTLFPIIENSKISVVILSPNYASSEWCLNELVKILNRKKTDGQIVIPVFYNVDPSEVEEQTDNYAKAFTEEHDGKQSPETIRKWRNALREVSELSGWNTAVTRPDSLLTEKIAKDILNKLIAVSPSYNKEGLVGIDSKIEAIESMLCLGSANSFAVGIWGIGGIGKTTLAKAVIDKIFTEFEDAYFFDNISKKSRQVVEYKVSQRNYIFSPVSNFTLERLWRKKVIVVFDNVSSVMEVESIIGFPLEKWENNGSRFIVTSRDKQVLKNLCRGNIYKLNGLFDDEAYQLFTQYACKGEFPITKHKDCLSKKVVQYTRGIPLALKVLGADLYNRDRQKWESAIEKLEKTPNKEVQSALEISYDGLGSDQKKMFLDIACFFCGESRDILKAYFDACDFAAEIELAILEDRCLIESDMHDKITMHDMIQRMGRDIDRQESDDDLGKRSRLWYHKDICQIFIENMETKAIEGISLDMSKISDINLKKMAFKKMKKLKLLNLYCSEYIKAINKVHVPHDFHFALNELRYFRWDGFPLRSLESGFNPRYLVKFHIAASNIEQLWGGVQPLFNLRTMSLITCYKLTAIPDISEAQNLQDLHIYFCPSFRSLPSLKFLTKLGIFYCPKLEVIPELPSNLEELSLCHTTIEELPSAIGHLSKLKELRIYDCSKFNSLPQNIGDIESLQKLDASRTAIEELPSSICKLKSLHRLQVSYNEKLARLPQNIGDIESLQELDASHTAIEELPSSICKLKSLHRLRVSYNEKLARLPQNIGDLESLQELDASHTAIEDLPSSVCYLLALVKLILCGAKLKCVPACILYLKSLEYLGLCGIEELETLPHDLANFRDLETLNFSETAKIEVCFRFHLSFQCCYERHAIFHEDLGNLKPVMEESPIWLYDAKLKCFPRNKLKSLVELSRWSTLPYSSGSLFYYLRDLEVFEVLDASRTSIKERPLSLCYTGRREYLGLSNCGILKLPDNFGQLNFLKRLNLSSNKFENLPASIIDLSQLESLNLSSCHRLQALPELPRDLYFLDASNCSSLKTLPSSSILFATSKTCYPKCTFLLGCYKLDKDSIRAITEYALLKPQLKVMAFQHDDLLKFQGYCMKNDPYVIYPGSEIPEWFSSQSIGSLITLELPLRCYNRKIVGIAVCAVVNLPCSKIGVYYKFEDEDGQSNGSKFEFFHGDYGYSTSKSLSAYHDYHVCIAYLPCNGSMSQLKSMTASFGFCVWRMTSSKEPPVICFDVKACGVRFLYGQNLRKRNRGFSSIDEELGSPNKRVRRCTNEDQAKSFSIVVDSLSSLEIL